MDISRFGQAFLGRLILLGLFFLPTVASTVFAADRVALVVSKGAYQHASPLSNPSNDARLVRRSLETVGFRVIPANDQGVDAFRRTLKEFRLAAEKAEVALIYYAGHGIEAKGENWLIPTDARLNSEQDLPDEAVNLQRVLDSVQGAKLRVVILDACRNNPFGRQWKSGTRSVNRGLSGLDADDVLVIYAAAPGQVASDGAGGNSPFAAALAERLPQPDLPVQLLGGAVRDDVLRATGGQQRPYVSASITGTPYYLAGRGAGTVAATPAAPAASGAKPAAIAAAPKPAAKTPVKYIITSAGPQDANFRQAREKLRKLLPATDFTWTPNVGEAEIVLDLSIGIVRSEKIGQREALVQMRVACSMTASGLGRSRLGGSPCPVLDLEQSETGTGPNFDKAEEAGIDAAVGKIANSAPFRSR